MLSPPRRLTAAVSAFLLVSAQVHPALAEATGERLAAAYESSAEALDKIVAGVPRADFSVSARAATLANADAALSFIVEQISHGLYRGSLKGADGTLEDRRGNSLDRSLLLAGLLAEKGLNARLARTTLSNDAIAKLAAAIADENHVPASALDAAMIDPILADFLADPRVNGTALSAAGEADAQEAAAATAASVALQQKSTEALALLVAAHLPAESAKDTALVLSDHWWVQIEDAGAWRDLDPDASVIGSQTATETMAVDGVPDNEKHRVTLRIVAESATEGGALSIATVLERTFDVANINGRILTLTAQPLNGNSLDEFLIGSPPTIDDYAAGSAWLPVIIADTGEVQSIIKSDGTLVEATASNIETLKETGAAGGFGKATAGLDLIGPPPEEAAASRVGLFTAAWLEFIIVAPGAPQRIERRVIFDAIGPAVRATGNYSGDIPEAAIRERGLTLRAIYAVTIQGGAVSPARAVGRLSESLATARRAVATWVRAGEDSTGPNYPDTFRAPQAELTFWALGRNTGGALDGANIAMMRQTVAISEAELVNREVFDIIANPVTATDGAARLASGVGDTVLEHQLMGSPATSINTAVRFAADLDAGYPWSVVTPGDATAFNALGLTNDVATLLQADLANGDIVVARPGMTANAATWWRIDPRTGETVGMTVDGGAETAEYVIASSIWIIVHNGYLKVACERAGGREVGQTYAQCAGAGFARLFARIGALASALFGSSGSTSGGAGSGVGGGIGGIFGDPLKGL